MNFKSVSDLSDIQTTCQLASKIWRKHYMPIIGLEQVEYMLAHFQSIDAIYNQIKAGYHYFLIQSDNQSLAYVAVLPSTQQKSLHISKLYVAITQQRQGLGTKIITFIENHSRQQNLHKLWLTVNRHNQTAIKFYLQNGFVKTDFLVQDIGGGFVMDDFKMEKKLL